MRQGPSNRRARGRGSNPGRRGNLPNRNQSFDSNGPDVRIRGNAYQVNEKYQALARDASATGDRVMAENYLQHAEHYYRIISAMNEAHSQTQQPYDGAGRDGVARDGNGRDNGQRGALRDGGPPRDRAVVRPDPTPSDPREVDSGQSMEFGEDPRQPDAREQRADDA
ncbi:MAG: DUF4167 domain-containing protein, partial [Alphaproteobacteria bacterium]